MIRYFDGSNGKEIAAQARGGRIFAIAWTWRKPRYVYGR